MALMSFTSASRPSIGHVFAAILALATAALAAACDTTATTGSDAGPDVAVLDGPADLPASPDASEVAPAPDGPIDGTPSDLGSDLPPVQRPAGCPAEVPAFASACSTPAEGVECAYRKPCANGRWLDTICTCAAGQWSCLSDRGCAPDEPILTTPPPECQGKCTGTATCEYAVERCVGTENLKGHCYCSNGTWACSREFDCYPPSTCRGADGCNCVTNGLLSTGNACPAGTTPGLCTSLACRPGEPRPGCIREVPGILRSAVCMYGAWACPIGYTLGQCRK
jgi:hypothetical protein